MSKAILKASREHVFKLYKEYDGIPLVYHNFNHTLDVVDMAIEIANASDLSKTDIEHLLIAAWFHDVGNLKQSKGHEEVSCQMATDFLREHQYDEDGIEVVCETIRATKFPQILMPKTKIAEILCDSDLHNLGTKEYGDKFQLLQMENSMLGLGEIGAEWEFDEIEFLTKHMFYTEYAQKKFAKGKEKNILKLREVRAERRLAEEKERIKTEKEESKTSTPEKGIETMFKVAFRNHINLSSIADNKANIMLSINAIIISIALSTLVPNLDDNPNLIIPTIILLIVCILTIVFATLSTRPKTSHGKFTKEDILEQTPNLLFFGNFHGMPLDDFKWGMNEMMKNKDFLYGSMIKDFYFLGVVLAKKYKLLRICYGVFMYGIIASVLAFVLAYQLS
jgi:HD-GYP domain-containing protein (c-di-GMP phosphodiesterase class II)